MKKGAPAPLRLLDFELNSPDPESVDFRKPGGAITAPTIALFSVNIIKFNVSAFPSFCGALAAIKTLTRLRHFRITGVCNPFLTHAIARKRQLGPAVRTSSPVGPFRVPAAASGAFRCFPDERETEEFAVLHGVDEFRSLLVIDDVRHSVPTFLPLNAAVIVSGALSRSFLLHYIMYH